MLFILALLAAVVGFGGIYWMFHRAESSSSSTVNFQVQTGDTVTSVANRLQKKGLIDNALFFRLDGRFSGLGSKLKPGNYTLRRNMTIDQMVGALSVYKEDDILVTIPEGKRIEEIAPILQRHGIDKKSFLQEARHPDLKYLNASILNDKPAQASLEGYLLPNTYKVPKHSSGRDFARDMVQLLDRSYTPAMRAATHAHKFSVYQVLTLASIVEREAVHQVERPKIAGVYANRIRLGWYLNADPTIQYAIGTPSKWWPVLQNEARLIDPNSPYNTYTHYGLPPGPIANPGIASIRAAVYPQPTRDMFFVAKGNTGYHAFAVTQAEQDANIARYQH
jgi:UPF0755 protein